MYVSAAAGHGEEHAEAAYLRNKRGCGGSSYAHVEDKDEERGEEDVQHGSRHDAHHSQESVALEAHLIVHRERGGHKRGAKKDDAEVSACVRKDGRRRTEHHGYVVEEQVTDYGYHNAEREAIEKAGGSHYCGVFGLLCAKLLRDIVA